MVAFTFSAFCASVLLASSIGHAQDTSTTSSTARSVPTAVTSCHSHSDGYYCFEGDNEWEVTSEVANAATAPEEYNRCRAGSNADTIQCTDAAGAQVTLVREGSEAAEEDHDHDHSGDDHDHDPAEESGSASATSTPSPTGAAAETSASASGANAGASLVPMAAWSLFSVLAYLAL